MPTYVSLITWTEEGIRNFQNAGERVGAFIARAEQAGGSVREVLYTMGEWDMVVVTEFPDDETSAAAVLQAGGLGYVRTRTMRAFSPGEMAAIVAAAS